MTTASPPSARASCRVPFGFLNAKLRARRSFLYEGPRLFDLSGEHTITDLAIKIFPREDVRDDLGLERRLKSGCVKELGFLAGFVAGPYQSLYSALLDRYAVANLKVLLRTFGQAVSGRVPVEERGFPGYLVELPGSLALPADHLMASENVHEFVRRIPLKNVRECAQAALPLYEETRRKAFLEMAFDKGYWRGVWEALSRLPRGESARCRAPLGCEFEAMRLLGTLRAAAVYGIPWEQWEAVMPVWPGAMGARALRRIYERPEVDFVREAVPRFRDALERFLKPGEAADFGRVEEALWHETVRLANRQYYTTTLGPAVLVSYFYLKRQELRHLLGLVQMVRYGKGEEEVEAQLRE